MNRILKSLIKYIFCFVAYYCGLVFLSRVFFRSRSALILTYHRVLSEDEMARCISQPGMVVSADSFRWQMEYLNRTCSVVSLSELIDSVGAGHNNDRICAVTFDDGWQDVYVNAYPILRAMNLSATVFLTTGFIGTKRLFWPERLTAALLPDSTISEQALEQLSEIDKQCAELVREVGTHSDRKSRTERIDFLIERLKLLKLADREAFVKTIDQISDEPGRSEESRHLLNWDEVAEMKAGGISFGSHTVNHVLLTKVSLDEAEREIRESKTDLENKLGEPVDLFAYPNGNWNEAVRDMVRDIGFRAAVIAANRRNSRETDPYLFGRLNIHEGMSLSPWKRFSRALFACETSRFLSLFSKLPKHY
ncbi:MAG: polysaccharide deacetylase family protein [Candidatus Zixiibacteriota bacterium]